MAFRGAANAGRKGLSHRACLWHSIKKSEGCSSMSMADPRVAGPAARASNAEEWRLIGTIPTRFLEDAKEGGSGDVPRRLAVVPPSPLPLPSARAACTLAVSAANTAELLGGDASGAPGFWGRGMTRLTDSSRGRSCRRFATITTARVVTEEVPVAVPDEGSIATEAVAEPMATTTASGRHKATERKTNSRGRWRWRPKSDESASNGTKGEGGSGRGAREIWSIGEDAIASGSLKNCNLALRACANRSEGKRAAALIARMKEAGIAPSDKSYSSAINACGRAGEWQRALALLREASSRDGADDGVPGAPNRRHYSAAINACATGQQPRQVMVLLSEMEQVGLEPDLSCYNAALRAVAGTCSSRQAHWKQAVDLLDKMEERKVYPDGISYTYALAACKASGEPEQALALLRRMSGPCGTIGAAEKEGVGTEEGGGGGSSSVDGSGVAPNTFHYTTVVSAFAVTERDEGWRQAVALLKEMLAVGVTPTAYTYNAAITACGKAGRYAQAVALLRQMPSIGIASDKLTYASAIEACGNGKQWPLAVALLREMSSTEPSGVGVGPDVIAYTAAIIACGKSGEWERALGLLREIAPPPARGDDDEGQTKAKTAMATKSLAPDEIVYNATITALEKSGQWRQALELLLEMPRAGLPPSAASFEPVIAACAGAGEWRQAVSLLEEMGKSVGVEPPSGRCYSDVIRVCRLAGEHKTAHALTKKRGTVKKTRRVQPALDKKLPRAATGAETAMGTADVR